MSKNLYLIDDPRNRTQNMLTRFKVPVGDDISNAFKGRIKIQNMLCNRKISFQILDEVLARQV